MDDKMLSSLQEQATESVLHPSLNYVGLENVANNCWLNALLQVLAHSSVGEWLIAISGVTTLGVVLATMIATLRLRLSQPRQRMTMNPSVLLRTFHNRNPSMLAGHQHDAHEGLVHLLNCTVTEHMKWTPLRAVIKDTRKCTQCNQVSENSEEWLHFVWSLSMQDCNSVQDCILKIGPQGDTKSELRCNKCKEDKVHHVQLTILDLPQFLVIRLMRCDNGGEKLDRAIQVAQEIDISSVCCSQSGRDPSYRLVAAVLHHGPSSKSGHYTALVKVDGCWHHFDDDKISTLNNGQVKAALERSAYLLFYEEKKEEQELKTPSSQKSTHEYSPMEKGKSTMITAFAELPERKKLLRISSSLSEDEVRKLKFVVKSKLKVDAHRHKEIKDGLDLFGELENSGELSYLCISELLKGIDRFDLVDILAQTGTGSHPPTGQKILDRTTECSGDDSDGREKPHHLKTKIAAGVVKDVVDCGPLRSPDRARVKTRSQHVPGLMQDALPDGDISAKQNVSGAFSGAGKDITVKQLVSDVSTQSKQWARFGARPRDRPPVQLTPPPEPSLIDLVPQEVTEARGLANAFLARHSQDQSLLESLCQGSAVKLLSDETSSQGGSYVDGTKPSSERNKAMPYLGDCQLVSRPDVDRGWMFPPPVYSSVYQRFPDSSYGVSFSSESSNTTVSSSVLSLSSVAEPVRVESCATQSVYDSSPRVTLGQLSAAENDECFSDTSSINLTRGKEEILESTRRLSNECESGDMERREDYSAKNEENGEVSESSGDVGDGPEKPHHLKMKSAASVAKVVVDRGPLCSLDRARDRARSQHVPGLMQGFLPDGDISMLESDFGTDSGESTDNSLLALEQRVEEACALVERVLREREKREQFGREIERKQREIREQRARKKRERETREQEEASRWPQQQEAITGRSQWLCEHYQRHCRVRFPCCTHFYPCHRCHNNSKACDNEEAKASHATHLKCSFCQHEQEVGEDSGKCRSCGSQMSAYFCSICKHFTRVDKNSYHCTKCGICRIHKDKSFHCEVCNVCLDIRFEGKHKCRPDSGHDECCICLEDVFSGCQILPCSHKVHQECAIAMIQNGIRSCPVCRHPLYSPASE